MHHLSRAESCFTLQIGLVICQTVVPKDSFCSLCMLNVSVMYVMDQN